MSIDKRLFGKTKDGIDVFEYTVLNSGRCGFRVITYGACLNGILVPDREGAIRDVCIGFPDPAAYEENRTGCAGAVIGRVGGRIAGASFVLDGKEYQLEKNNGKNTLHSGNAGFDKVVWEVAATDEYSVSLHYLSPDGDQNFPGNLDVTVTYSVTEDNSLVIAYDAGTDRKTLCDITNHCYFNLNGHQSGNILCHQLQMLADWVLDVGTDLIPTGKLIPVGEVPFGFTVPSVIGKVIRDSFECENVSYHGGIDTNYCVGSHTDLRHMATLYSEDSGIEMRVITDQPSVHVYTGMCLDFPGKNHASYQPYAGIAMLTEHYTDSVHHPEFPSYELEPGQKYHTVTKYCFSVRK